MVESSRTILSENGRKIQIIDLGMPDSIPILVLHGAQGLILLYGNWAESSLAQRHRLIRHDRPSYSASSPDSGRKASAVNDLATISKALDFYRPSVCGLSVEIRMPSPG